MANLPIDPVTHSVLKVYSNDLMRNHFLRKAWRKKRRETIRLLEQIDIEEKATRDRIDEIHLRIDREIDRNPKLRDLQQ